MKKIIVIIVIQIVAVFSILSVAAIKQASFNQTCETILGDKNKILALPYQDFDQNVAGSEGWRKLANANCFRQAAELIDDYLIANPKLVQHQQANLFFYGGQMWALVGNYKKAVQDLKQARIKTEPMADVVRWNAYVNATIAFLQHNKKALQKYRQQIAGQQPIDGEIINLKMVDAMLANMKKPYLYVYKLMQ